MTNTDYSEQRIAILTLDGDVTIIMPTGDQITVQYRCENDTIDILLDKQWHVHVHPDDDLGNPKRAPKDKSAWLAKQIVLC